MFSVVTRTSNDTRCPPRPHLRRRQRYRLVVRFGAAYGFATFDPGFAFP